MFSGRDPNSCSAVFRVEGGRPFEIWLASHTVSSCAAAYQYAAFHLAAVDSVPLALTKTETCSVSSAWPIRPQSFFQKVIIVNLNCGLASAVGFCRED